MAESEVVKAIRKQREEIAQNELDTLRRMARLWVPSYRYLQEQVSALMRIIQDKRDKGETVEMEYIYSLKRYQTMMEQAAVTIRKYNKAIAGLINGAEAEATDLGQKNAQQLVSIAEPDHEMWTRVNRRETTIAAGMTAEGAPLDSLLEKSFGQMKEGLEQALITGISTGQGSSWIVDQMMQAAQIPERRALLIARTEVNRAYRQSNWNQMRSSRAVLGYRRMCHKGTACFACLMLDKEFYPVDEEPTDHPNGKCSFVPVTRHFDPGNDPSWQGGREYFDSLPEEAQRKLMGPGRFDLWKQGGVDPRDMVWIKPNKVWGGSPATKTLEEMGFGNRGSGISAYLNMLNTQASGVSLDTLFEKRDRTDNPKISKLLSGINRNFYHPEASGDYQNNCQRCVPTYEAARRGYKVKAKPNPNHGNDFLEKNPFAVFEGFNPKDKWDGKLASKYMRSGLVGDGKADVERWMKIWGSGARGEVFVHKIGADYGHVFIVENQNGEIKYYDPQTGSEDASGNFENIRRGLTILLRIDKLEFSEYISDCTEQL